MLCEPRLVNGWGCCWELLYMGPLPRAKLIFDLRAVPFER